MVRTRWLAAAIASRFSRPRGLSMSRAISVRPGAIPRSAPAARSRRPGARPPLRPPSSGSRSHPGPGAPPPPGRSASMAASWLTRTKTSAPPRATRGMASADAPAGRVLLALEGTASSRSSMTASAPRRWAFSTNRGTLTGRISVDRLMRSLAALTVLPPRGCSWRMGIRRDATWERGGKSRTNAAVSYQPSAVSDGSYVVTNDARVNGREP